MPEDKKPKTPAEAVSENIGCAVVLVFLILAGACNFRYCVRAMQCDEAIKANNIEAIRLTCGDQDYPDLPAERPEVIR